MSATTLNLTVPSGWHELNDRRLLALYRMLGSGLSAVEMKILCIIRWNNIKIMGRRGLKGNFLLRKDGVTHEVEPKSMAELLPSLDWMDEMPSRPVRPSRLKRRRALPADMMGVSFETFMVCDNLYQGFLATQSDDILDDLARELYPGLRGAVAMEERLAVFYWWASLKSALALKYPDFFQPVGPDGGNTLGAPSLDVEGAMNAQIRALTKGDITKESTVLALDTHRALTELNAQAREYHELNTHLHASK